MKAKFAYHANCWGPLGGNAVGVTSISATHLSHLRRYGAGDRGNRRGRLRRASNSSTAICWIMLTSGTRCSSLLDKAGRSIGRCLFRGEFHISGHSAAGTGAHRARREARRRLRRGASRRRRRSETRRRNCAATIIDRLADGLEKIVRSPSSAAYARITIRTSAPSSKGRRKSARIFGMTSIDFCPDTAHLAAAGGDPAEMIREHRARISYVHLKGLAKERRSPSPRWIEGDLDISAIMRVLDRDAFRWLDHRGTRLLAGSRARAPSAASLF